jgi:hypothetical protein
MPAGRSLPSRHRRPSPSQHPVADLAAAAELVVAGLAAVDLVVAGLAAAERW